MILDYRRPKLTRRAAYSSIPRKLNRESIWIVRVVLLLARHERPPAAQGPLPHIPRRVAAAKSDRQARRAGRAAPEGLQRSGGLAAQRRDRKSTRLNSSH